MKYIIIIHSSSILNSSPIELSLYLKLIKFGLPYELPIQNDKIPSLLLLGVELDLSRMHPWYDERDFINMIISSIPINTEMYK